MNRVSFSTRLFVPAALGLLLGSHSLADEIEVGRPFPTLTLPSLDEGQPLSVASFQGKKRVLHIWASW